MTLSLSGIEHGFGNHTVLKDVKFTVQPGEVHALLGMNGAGKSTLLHLAAGVYTPRHGTVDIDGVPLNIRSPREAAALGIVFLTQEVDRGLISQLSVHENLTVSLLRSEKRLLFRRGDNRKRVDRLLREYDLDVPADRLVGNLTIYEKQMLSIIRAVEGRARYLLLDEPTASFDKKEAAKFKALVERLKSQGVGIVLVSHRLHELRELADRVSVLRDGKIVWESAAAEASVEQLAEAMTGGEAKLSRRAVSYASAEPAQFVVRGIRSRPGRPELSIAVRKGEIVAVFGHLGSGKTSLARTLFGAGKPIRAWISGVEHRIRSTRHAAGLGIAYVPEERGKQGIWKRYDIRSHLSLAFQGLISRKREMGYSNRLIGEFDIRPGVAAYKVGALSGGNQQKVAIAKWFSRAPKLAIFDEPMKGIDVVAKETIFQAIEKLAEEGASVLYLTAEPDDALRIADRVVVLSRGRIAAEWPATEATASKLFQAAEEEEQGDGND